MSDHIYFRNRRQYQLDKLWQSIEEIERKRKGPLKVNHKTAEDKKEWWI